jgi:hypothetical protein
MATERAETAQPVAGGLDEVIATLGGAPLPEPAPAGAEGDKQTRKRRKREARLRRDSARVPDSWERFRILSELISEGRQVVEIADHKARYALVVLGALNAGVFFLISRAHLIATIPSGVRPWLLGFLIAYAGLSFLFMLYAIDCLRPRHLDYAEYLPKPEDAAGRAAGHVPRGVLFWEGIADFALGDYRRAWGEVHMDQINSEVVVIAHRLAKLIRAKYAALGKLFVGLGLLIGLAAVLLGLLTALSLASQ